MGDVTMSKNSAVLIHNAQEFIAQVNLPAYFVSHFNGTIPPKASIAFNTNYSWLGIPIGLTRASGIDLFHINAKNDKRPCLVITWEGVANIVHSRKITDWGKYSVIMQAGPSLIKSYRDISQESIPAEEFRPDAIRKTQHVAIGVTKLGKLIIGFFNHSSPTQMASSFMELEKSHGVRVLSAMKMDGGSKSYLAYNEYGTSFLGFGKDKKTVIGLALTPKQGRLTNNKIPWQP